MLVVISLRRFGIAAALLAGLPLAALAQPTAIGGEFLVNTYTTGQQRFPNVCAAGGSDFVVAWEDGYADAYHTEHGIDGSEAGVVGGRIGTGSGSDFMVNTYTTGRQAQASVACLDNGGFVVVWNEAETYPYGPDPKQGHFAVTGRIYDDSGTSGAPFDVEEQEDLEQFGDPPDEGSVCRGPGDGFVVVWNTDESTKVRRFDAQGAAQGQDVTFGQVNNPKCCGNDAGFVVVGWQGVGASGQEILARRFDSAGAAAGTAFVVNSYTTGAQWKAAVGCNAAGRFVVVWESAPGFVGSNPPQDGDGAGVFGQLFAASGSPLNEEFQASVYTTHDQIQPSVAMDGPGRFVVAWNNYFYDEITEISDEDIFAREYDASANPVGTEFQVNTYTTENSSNPSVAIDSEGELVVVWYTKNDGDDHSISGQRYSLGAGPTTTTLPPNEICGDPVAFQASRLGVIPPSNNVTASDALFALKTAVGTEECAPCVCDVDHSGSVAATDALIVLKFAVGQAVTLDCPPC